MMLTPAQVTVVILNYKGVEDTLCCLNALQRLEQQPGRIIVVDNNSGKKDVARLTDAWSTANILCHKPAPVILCQGDCLPNAQQILLTLDSNNGFASGNNAGIRLALSDTSCKALWLLNNDTEPEKYSLHYLCQRLNKIQGASIAGATVAYHHNRSLVQCAAGGFLNRWIGTSKLAYAQLPLEEVLKLEPTALEASLDDILGASMLIKRDVFDRIGFFSEEFFLYTEETEFCLRAGQAGILFAWGQKSIIYHKEGASTGAQTAIAGREFSRPAWVDYLALRNRVYMIRKHYPWALPLVLLSYLGVMLNRVRRGQADRIPLVCRAAWDGLRGRMGKPDHLFPALRDSHENPSH
ncbi:glycosyltransferase family 2 protein [Desulfovibrio falkowii]